MLMILRLAEKALEHQKFNEISGCFMNDGMDTRGPVSGLHV